MTKEQIISKAMSLLAKRRTPEQRKGGPKLQKNRCPCGRYTRHTAKLRNHKCVKGVRNEE